jgi:hypothetical protein
MSNEKLKNIDKIIMENEFCLFNNTESGNFIEESNTNQASTHNRADNLLYPVSAKGKDFKKCDCISKLSECSICKGLIPRNLFEKHKEMCLNFHNSISIELINCEKCDSLVNFHNFNHHICPVKYSDKSNPIFPDITMSKNFPVLNCTYCCKEFFISLIEEHEATCYQQQTDIIMIESTIPCSICNLDIKIMSIESHEKECKLINDKSTSLDKLLSTEGIEFPPFWTEMKSSNTYELIPISTESDEFHLVKENLSINDNLIKISSIQRVQNVNLFTKYFREKNKIKKEKGCEVEEKLLFYVNSKQNESIHASHICKLGFDISFAQDQLAYGRGIYFKCRADKSVITNFNIDELNFQQDKNILNQNSLFFPGGINSNNNNNIFSNNFSKNRLNNILASINPGPISSKNKNQIINPFLPSNNSENSNDKALIAEKSKKVLFLATVLVGKSFFQSKPNFQMRKPPFLDESKFIYYDSITNSESETFIDRLFVIYNSEKAYPLYMIEYELVCKKD